VIPRPSAPAGHCALPLAAALAAGCGRQPESPARPGPGAPDGGRPLLKVVFRLLATEDADGYLSIYGPTLRWAAGNVDNGLRRMTFPSAP